MRCIMNTTALNRLCLPAASLLLLAAPTCLNAAALYLDNNGVTTGSGITNGGTVAITNSISTFFNPLSTGTGTVQSATTADDLFFSAGTDAGAAYTVSLKNYSLAVNSLTMEEGAVTFLKANGATTKTDVTIGLGGLAATQNVIFDVNTILAAAQTWTIASGKSVTVAATNGNLANGGFTLSFAGLGDAIFNGAVTGLGGLTLTDGGNVTLNTPTTGTTTYSGATTVNAGTLYYNVTNTATAATVGGSGTLAGTGSIGAITLNSGGFIAPGAQGSTAATTFTATGLTWNGGGVMRFNLGTANASDRLALGTGAFTKGTGSTWSFDFLNSGTAGNTYTLISGTALGNSFSASNFTYTNLAAGLAGTFAYNAASGLTFAVTVIPEGEFALGAIMTASTCVLLRRRRQRRA